MLSPLERVQRVLLRKDQHPDLVKKHLEGINDKLVSKIEPKEAEELARNYTALELGKKRNAIKAEKYQGQSIVDSLTNLYNIGYLEGDGSKTVSGIGQLQREFNQAYHSGHDLSVLMIDIDNFKEYNDSYTHPEGNIALKTIADTIREIIRTSDLPFRYGGEELLILLPETNLHDAGFVAEKIRKKIEEITVLKRKVTVSIGTSSYNKKENTYKQQNVKDKSKLVELADHALYFSKKNGKNIVTLGNELTEEQILQAHAETKK
jgi:diguanylate cyclase (GGDEF)-like protein